MLLAFAMCGGAAVYLSVPFEPTLTETIGLFSGGAILIVLVRRFHSSNTVYASVIALFGVVLGYSAGALRARLVDAPIIERETRPVMLEGWVANIESGQKGPRLKINVHSIAGFPHDALPKTVRVTHRARIEVSSGRFVRCWVVLRPPPSPTISGDYDFRRQAYFQQLGAVGYVQGRCRGGALGAPHSFSERAELWIAAKRRNAAVYINDAAGERAGGLAAALIAGDRSFLSQEDQEAMRNTGLAHLLAISGLHLSIVGGLTFFMVRRLLVLIEPLALRVPVQKIAAVVALTVCAAYLIASGATVSTQRAFIMAAIVFLAVVFDRAAISLRTFAVAFIVIVLVQPESVLTPGFQMSFAATGALIAAYEVWRNHRSTKERVLGPMAFAWASIIVTSVVSDAATAPFSFYHFDRLSPVGLFANFAIMPVVTFVAAPAAALAVILAIFGHADIGLHLFGQSLELVLSMTHFFNDLSPGVVRMPVPMPSSALLCLSLSLAAIMIFSGWMRILGGLALMLPAVLLWIDAPRILLHWSASGDVFIADDSGYVSRIELTKGEGLAPLRFSEAEDAPVCGAPVCDYSSLDGRTIRISGMPGQTDAKFVGLHIALGRSSTQPEMELDWSEIEALGSVSIYIQNGELRLSRMQNCTERPWRRCSSNAQSGPKGAAAYFSEIIHSGE
ncbi:ComEC family competence protein [Hyphomonas sp. WL0036]|uniref:ComEC/Rec2 family competence protein n=1 Tax=Hyphomonas sediminis TaxID=2866160 RepID=UPI001C81A9A6|nr:ComEC/Rec2 family competence protein [Hyphomonas sediminis]MBY9067589.1 ComEC family competence protein [Hyphomonas sediminis]